MVHSASTIRLGVYQINQYKATNVNYSTTKSQFVAELGPAQPQLVLLLLPSFISKQSQLLLLRTEVELVLDFKRSRESGKFQFATYPH